MSTVTASESRFNLRYTLTAKAVIERVKAIGNSDKDVSVTIMHGDPQFSRAVDLLGLEEMSGRSRSSSVVVSGNFDSFNLTADVILDAIEAAQQAKQQEYNERRDAYEAEVQRLLTCDPKTLLCNRYGTQDAVKNPATDDKEWQKAPQESFWFPKEGQKPESRNEPLSDPRCAGVVAELTRLSTVQDQSLDAKEAAIKSAVEQEQLDWINANGSSRLKRATAEGINCDAIYRDERLALDRPGWCWYSDCDGKSDHPRNPPDEAFEVLDEARKVEPTAKLQYHVIEAAEMEDENGYATGDMSPAWRGYTAEAPFLGNKLICFGIPEEYR